MVWGFGLDREKRERERGGKGKVESESETRNPQNQTHARPLPPFPRLLTSGGLLSLYHCAWGVAIGVVARAVVSREKWCSTS
jgi:hypothetical protein